MFRTIIKSLKSIEIDDTTDRSILVLKGMYKLPTSMKDIRNQSKFKKQWQK